MSDSITRGDKWLLALATSVVVILYFVFWGGNTQARHAEVLVAGEKKYILDLNEEKRVEIQGKLGKSIIEIRNGEIRFVESPCSSKQCIRSGWISQVNELAACLPNGVSLHLVGPNARFDSINF
ncbi:MAG: NusG domain II-containing protein [Gammaproteobacteria bacterium]|nr:NusG domain II-containing protein [Gammaproteobacteria bacterium]